MDQTDEKSVKNGNQEVFPIQNIQIPQHGTFQFEVEGKKIVFSSDFDSGNCGRVQQIKPLEYDIWTAADCVSGKNQQGYPKSWFYFVVSGFPKASLVQLNIQRIHMLWNLYNTKSQQSYRPVIRIGEQGEWKRFQNPIQLDLVDNKLILSFEFLFDDDDLEVGFAFSYPYEYSRCLNMVRDLQRDYTDDPQIYFQKEVIAYSPHLRYIHLLTISSHQGQTETPEQYMSESLFPQRNYETRPIRTNKPVVLISARVHPGESPGSYALEGIIRFLLSQNDARAALLRRFFVFLIIPMLNPDGVYHGHYRMDIFNQNLNRFYRLACYTQQPGIYALRHLVEYLDVDKRLFFYCDLHAHAGQQGHFFYGNAIEDFTYHVESQVFAKLMSINCKHFEYNYCNFSKKHMKARDRFEELTKEGCARVGVYQMTGIIHSYTLECGFHQATMLNETFPALNEDYKMNCDYSFQNDLIEDQGGVSGENIPNQSQSQNPFFTPEIYMSVGRAILISILDIFQQNPYSRVPQSNFKNLDHLRREVGWECARTDRFRRDPYSYRKARKFPQYIYDSFFQDFQRRNVFKLEGSLAEINWPDNIAHLMLVKLVRPLVSNSKSPKQKKNQFKSQFIQQPKIMNSSNFETENDQTKENINDMSPRMILKDSNILAINDDLQENKYQIIQIKKLQNQSYKKGSIVFNRELQAIQQYNQTHSYSPSKVDLHRLELPIKETNYHSYSPAQKITLNQPALTTTTYGETSSIQQLKETYYNSPFQLKLKEVGSEVPIGGQLINLNGHYSTQPYDPSKYSAKSQQYNSREQGKQNENQEQEKEKKSIQPLRSDSNIHLQKVVIQGGVKRHKIILQEMIQKSKLSPGRVLADALNVKHIDEYDIKNSLKSLVNQNGGSNINQAGNSAVGGIVVGVGRNRSQSRDKSQYREKKNSLNDNMMNYHKESKSRNQNHDDSLEVSQVEQIFDDSQFIASDDNEPVNFNQMDVSLLLQLKQIQISESPDITESPLLSQQTINLTKIEEMVNQGYQSSYPNPYQLLSVNQISQFIAGDNIGGGVAVQNIVMRPNQKDEKIIQLLQIQTQKSNSMHNRKYEAEEQVQLNQKTTLDYQNNSQLDMSNGLVSTAQSNNSPRGRIQPLKLPDLREKNNYQLFMDLYQNKAEEASKLNKQTKGDNIQSGQQKKASSKFS